MSSPKLVDRPRRVVGRAMIGRPWTWAAIGLVSLGVARTGVAGVARRGDERVTIDAGDDGPPVPFVVVARPGVARLLRGQTAARGDTLFGVTPAELSVAPGAVRVLVQGSARLAFERPPKPHVDHRTVTVTRRATLERFIADGALGLYADSVSLRMLPLR